MDRLRTHKWNAADAMTLARMACSCLLVGFPAQSAGFFALYSLAGLTDALDGWLARRSGTASDFGARLDSIADLLFYSVALLRLLPFLFRALPAEIWYAVALVVLVRLAAYGTAAVRYRRFASLHTWLNKLTGAAVFLLPYVVATSAGVGYAWAVCALAMTASLEELALHLAGRQYRPEVKSIFQAMK